MPFTAIKYFKPHIKTCFYYTKSRGINRGFIAISIIFSFNGEECLRVSTYRAYVRGFFTYNNMSTVSALPNLVSVS